MAHFRGQYDQASIFRDIILKWGKSKTFQFQVTLFSQVCFIFIYLLIIGTFTWANEHHWPEWRDQDILDHLKKKVRQKCWLFSFSATYLYCALVSSREILSVPCQIMLWKQPQIGKLQAQTKQLNKIMHNLTETSTLQILEQRE